MGLSSNKTSTTSNQTQNTNQTENATTTPVTPDWLTNAAQDYVGRIGSFGDMDPNSFVAGASPLQQQAWQNAGSLGDWRQQTATASQMAQQAGQGGANLAGQMGGGSAQMAAMQQARAAQQQAEAADSQGGIKTMSAPAGSGGQLQRPQNAFSGASSQGGPAYTYQAPNLGNPGSPTAYGAAPTTLGNPGLVSGQGYSAPQLGNAAGYAAARTGSPIGATATGYNPAMAGQTNIAQTPGATATNANSASLLDNLGAYQNPYTQQVVDTSLADFDNQAAQSRARMEAQGAAAGAFGGSRFGIAQGQMVGDQDRARATLDAGLRDQGFNTATGLSQADAAMRQQTGLFNAQNQTQNSQFNSAQDAARAQAQAGYDSATGFANQQALNAEGAQFAGAQNSASAQNAAAGNQFALDYAGRQDTAGSQQAAAQNQFGLAQAGLNADSAKYGADSAMQAGIANQQMRGQYDLAQFGANTNAAANYAGAQNQAGLAGYQGQLSQAQLLAQLQAQAGQYNAGANNNMSQFNATQGDNAANRQLQAAGMLGSLANDYGAGTRADLATMGQLGDQQRNIEQAYAMAGPAQLQLMGQLSGMTPYDILVGRNVNGTTNGTMTGTSTGTTTQTPSLFDSLLKGAGTAAAFF